MSLSTGAQEQGCEISQLTARENAIYNGTDLKHQQYLTTSNTPTTTIPMMIPSSANLSAIAATFNTTELLEQILSYLPAPQLLTSKTTSRTFRNAIETSPMLRRKTDTFLRLGDVDQENDSFSTDAGGEVVFPLEGLEALAFFYPGDGERRLFVRFGDVEKFLRRMGKADGSGFRGLRVVDQWLGDIRVGWHCECSEERSGEVQMVCEGERVTFGDVLGAVEGEHRAKGKRRCGSLRKFWVDGSWKRSGEMREFG